MNINVSDQAVWKSSRSGKVDLTPLFSEQWLYSNTWIILFSKLYSHYKVTLKDDQVDIYCIMYNVYTVSCITQPFEYLVFKKEKNFLRRYFLSLLPCGTDGTVIHSNSYMCGTPIGQTISITSNYNSTTTILSSLPSTTVIPLRIGTWPKEK